MKHILFDLDGTLTESAPGIINSAKYALHQMGYSIPDDAILEKFVGPPLLESFSKHCGMDEASAKEALRLYRVYFREKGMFENSLYENIPELLEKLCARGFTVNLATSKPEEFAVQILKHFGIYKYFSGICGASMDGSFHEKADVIGKLISDMGYAPEDCVMVGDRKHDVLGASAWGIMCIGVVYGYGGREELEKAGADLIAESTTELEKILLND